MNVRLPLLKFRCTGCGNCCRDPLLPLTDADLKRIVSHSGLAAAEVIKWVTRWEIDLAGEPEHFVRLRTGRRVMVLRHMRGRCRFLGRDDRCGIYSFRPLGCRIFPFDPQFARGGKLVRLRMIEATDCPYEKDGSNNVRDLYRLHTNTQRELASYLEKVAEWNGEQARQQRRGKKPAPAPDFLRFLGV